MNWKLLSHQLRRDEDVVTARQRARQIAACTGFDVHEQTRIATAVSEIARNAFRYAGGGLVSFEISGGGPQYFVTTVADRGPGIADSELVMSGQYVSTSGMGIGLAGAKRLMDGFDLQTGPAGTTVTLRMRIPAQHAVGAEEANRIGRDLQMHAAPSPVDELQQQNQELLRAIDEVHARQQEIQRLNNELEETNRGVLALNAELEDKAESLRRASETKSRFLSHMSHEFRTPLNSIRSLTAMLSSRLDGPLTSEQQRQVEFISRAADSLLDLVNDLLDLAKIEAGKVEVRPSEFSVDGLFATLRGMFRPLMHNDAVVLRFGDVSHLPFLFTDESKLSQILRNLISNAVKYTESGEIEVTARVAGGRISVAVRDTGIGIPPEHLSSLFREFVQITNPLQKRAKGTGLGLSLSQQLAVLLGGSIEVTSVHGRGTTFTVAIPVRLYASADQSQWNARAEAQPRASDVPVVLIVDDEAADRYALRSLMPAACEVLEATGGESALAQLARRLPDIVFLDLGMADISGVDVLAAIKNAPDTRDVRVVVHSSLALDGALRAQLLGSGAEAIIEKGYTDLEATRRRIIQLIDPLRRQDPIR